MFLWSSLIFIKVKVRVMWAIMFLYVEVIYSHIICQFCLLHFFLSSGQGAHPRGHLPVSKIWLPLLYRRRLWWAHYVQQQRFPPGCPQLQWLSSEMVWFRDPWWGTFKCRQLCVCIWNHLTVKFMFKSCLPICVLCGFLSGDTLYYRFMSDMSNTEWGYKFTVTGGHRGRFQTGTDTHLF